MGDLIEPKKNSGLSLDQNLAAVLCYLFLAIGGVVFYSIEKENKFIRFAAMQSILYTVFIVAGFFIGGIFSESLSKANNTFAAILNLLGIFFVVGIIGVWGLLIYKALNGIELVLPIIGKMAKDTIK